MQDQRRGRRRAPPPARSAASRGPRTSAEPREAPRVVAAYRQPALRADPSTSAARAARPFWNRERPRARASSSSLIARAASARRSRIDAVRRKWSDHRDGGCGRMHLANRIRCFRRSRDNSKDAPAPNAPPTSPRASRPPSPRSCRRRRPPPPARPIIWRGAA